MKDVKSKPKTTKQKQYTPKQSASAKPKTAQSFKASVPVSTVDTLKHQYAQKKAEIQKQTSEQTEKPENYAVDEVEDRAETAVYAAADVIARTGKNIKQKVRKRKLTQAPTSDIHSSTDIAQQTKALNTELAETSLKPKLHEQAMIKTRQSVMEQKQSGQKAVIKTKESVLAHKGDNTVPAPTAQQRQTAAIRAEKHKSVVSPTESAAIEETPKSSETPMRIKTKDEYLKQKTETTQIKSEKVKQPFQPKTLQAVRARETEQPPVDKSQAARRKYVQNKLKAQADAVKNTVPQTESQTILIPDIGYSTETATVPDMPIVTDSRTIHKQKSAPEKLIKTKKADIKTRDSYILSHNGTNIKAKSAELDSPRIITADKSSIKSKPKGITNIVRNKTEHIKTSVSKPARVVKTANRSIKSAKAAVKKKERQLAKQAAKKAVRQAREVAQKSAQAVKAGVKYAVRLAKTIATAAAGIAKTAMTAISAMGGIAVVVTVLIIVIIIAAIAASPFGIFFSEEANDVGTIPLSQIIAEYNVELTQSTENIELSVPHTDVMVTDNQTNSNVVIAVFAAKTAGAEDETATDVVVFDAEKAEKLNEFFRTANTVEYTVEPYNNAGGTGNRLNITVTGKTKEELMDYYELTAKQREAVETLLEQGDVLTSSSHSLAVTDANVRAIVEGLPASLPQKRKDVVKNAASLVGKVNYFWGGKSSAIGWDSAWGTMQRVTAEGSPSSGTIRAYGLDCSGFVTWAFNNSGMGYAVGHGTYGQRDASVQVSASTVQAGDLCFLPSYSHVGIVVGKDADGNILVIHCSSGANNVVLSTASSVGFTVFRRPNCY